MSNYTEISADGASGSVICNDATVWQIEGEGTFGGGTLTPQKKSYDGTWIALGSTSLTADGAVNVEVPKGTEIRANLSGATSPSIKVHISRVS
jgi:hypothetical protein